MTHCRICNDEGRVFSQTGYSHNLRANGTMIPCQCQESRLWDEGECWEAVQEARCTLISAIAPPLDDDYRTPRQIEEFNAAVKAHEEVRALYQLHFGSAA